MAMERDEARVRSHHTDLRPLATIHMSAGRRISNSPMKGYAASASPNSAISLASPSLAAVRKYYQNHGLRTAFQTESSPTEHIAHFSQNLPRRHSLLSPGGLVARIENIVVSSPGYGQGGEYVRERESIADVSRDMLLDGVHRSELAKLGGVVARRPSWPRPNILPTIPEKVLSNPTHQLRAWGPAYLGNAATADVYVKAVQLRKLNKIGGSSNSNSSKQRGHSEEFDELRGSEASTANSKNILVRARVLPRAKERKPFLIQRRFNLDEMRASAPVSKIRENPRPSFVRPHHEGLGQAKDLGMHTFLKRSKSDSSAELKPSNPSCDRVPLAKASMTTGRRIMVMPIHVDYALHYLPVLAALMLSGHIRKGDAIDLPMPNPWVWREVVLYIYTGQGIVTPAMKENILYLAGRVD